MSNILYVRHNMEVAHRLSLLPGKCQNIHGHSMQVKLSIFGLELNENGVAGNIDFGALKKVFRNYIDANYDHHLHLNQSDPWAQMIYMHQDPEQPFENGEQHWLPGLVTHSGDPTVENLAKWIALDMATLISENFYLETHAALSMEVEIQETNTNGASWIVQDVL